jgi:WD40 repeat protein
LALSTVSNFLNGKPIDRAIFEEICSKLGLDWKEIADFVREEPLQSSQDVSSNITTPATAELHQDWGEAPDSITFYGRVNELVQLRQWIVQDRCRLVLLLGMGGTGKTALSVQLLEQIGDRFDALIWRSLRNAPTLQILLSDLILSLSHQQAVLSNQLESQLLKLIELLRQNRCLLVLDNAESILQGGEVGQYREGYETYDELFCRIADGRHQSSLILTSREQPRSLTSRISDKTPVRSLCLNGLPLAEGQQLLIARGLVDSDRSFQQLVHTYSGNPLAIKIAAATIYSTFSGNINQFLQQQVITYGGIWDLLNQQFDRLSPLEQQVMYWLAIEREWISFENLSQNWIPPIAQRQLVEALESLQGRSLIEISKTGFTQQPVVMEYMTQKLIDHCHQEITKQTLNLVKSHALLKAQTQDYIRDTQARLILQPLAQKLLATPLNGTTVELLFEQLLDTLRGQPLSYTGYAAGNLINLLATLQSDLSDRDFSKLAIAQAYLTETTLHRSNFTDATLHQSVFAETLGGIVAVAFSPDGKLLAASDTCGDVHVWHIHNNQKLLTLSRHQGWVFSLIFSPNGMTLASASTDYIVKLWDLNTGACLQTLKGPANLLNAVTFSPDQRMILTLDQDAAIQLWNIDHLELQIARLQGFTYLVRSTAVSPDRKTIANSTQDQTIRFWNIQTGDCEKVLQSDHPTVRLIAYSPDGRYLATTSLDPAIQLWDLSTDQCFSTLEGHIQSISEVTFSADSRYLASSSYDQTVKVWEVATGHCLKTLYGHREKLMAVAFSPDGRQLVSGGGDHAVKLWDLQTGKCVKTFRGHTNGIPAIALSPDQQTLASTHEDMTVKLWDLPRGRVIKILPPQSDLIWAVAFADSEPVLALAIANGTVKLWNLQTDTHLTSLGHRNWVWSIAFHPNGQLFATGSYDETIKLWDTQTGECLSTLTGHNSAVLCVRFSLNGKYLISSSFDQTIRVWDVETGSCVQILRGHGDRVWQVTLSSNGQLASCSFDQTIKRWDIETGTCLNTLTGHQGAVTSIAFSPDNQKLVSGSYDQTIKIWDVSTGQCLQTLKEHTSGILSVLFEMVDCFEAEGLNQSDRPTQSPLIISSSLDGTIKFWHPETGKCLKTLIAPRPYEGMNMTRLSGLTEAQLLTLKTLGAYSF